MFRQSTFFTFLHYFSFTANYLKTAADRPDEDDSDDCIEGVDDLCPNSEEEEEDVDGNIQFGTTPPAPRIQKRMKSKSLRGCYNYKSMLNEKRQQQPKIPVNVIKKEDQGGPSLCDLREFDSDDNLEGSREKLERRRRENKKTLTRIRRSDQTEKRLSEDFSNMSVGDSLGLSHLANIKLEGSGRFNHRLQNLQPPLSLSVDCRPRRQIQEPPQCQEKRVKFYHRFSTLIKIGTEAKKREEKSSYKRQFSIEQEQQRIVLIEQIWIELRAYLDDDMSAEEQNEYLKRERQTHDSVIEEINTFSFAELAAQDCPDSAFVRDTSTLNLFFKPNNESYRDIVSRSVSASFSDVNLTDETVSLQEKALIQVQRLLEKLDNCESCYSTTQAFCKANGKYNDPIFQRRVKCLNLWLNITCDLCQKLKLFGRIIGVNSRSQNWPLLRFELPQVQPKEFLASPRPSIPNIVNSDTSDNNDGSDEEEDISKDRKCNDKLEMETEKDGDKQSPNQSQSQHQKQVTFLCGGDDEASIPSANYVAPFEATLPIGASTPVRNPSQIHLSSLGSVSSALNISRASSEVSLDEIHSKPSNYRHYAEKCLRKMGLNKLNRSLSKLFHASLIRAKEALERPKESLYVDAQVNLC